MIGAVAARRILAVIPSGRALRARPAFESVLAVSVAHALFVSRALGVGNFEAVSADWRKVRRGSENGWWGRQDSNLRSHRRLIYSQLPLPLGTLPRSTPSHRLPERAFTPKGVSGRPWMTWKRAPA